MKLTFFETPPLPAIFGDIWMTRATGICKMPLEDPKRGDVIPGTGGFRKLRWEDRRRGKGKRGRLRVIYYYLEDSAQIWMFTLYDKDQAAD